MNRAGEGQKRVSKHAALAPGDVGESKRRNKVILQLGDGTERGNWPHTSERLLGS